LSAILNNNQTVKILLGVTGGIAAYKSAELVRRLKDFSFDVRVVMTDGAKQFITPMTMQAISGHPVHDAIFDRQAEAAMGHIELAKWADIILIAPATANCIAKVAHGLADDLLTTVILASNAQLMIAPAMNQQMWANKAVEANIHSLKLRNINILGPAEGVQACGDNGFGRMLEPIQIAQELFDEVKNRPRSSISTLSLQKLKGKNILITAGPTLEAIDPVRYISNHSSGKMAYALAKQALESGAEVTLVSGPVKLSPPAGVKIINVVSALEMLEAVKQEVEKCDCFIGCAAVADYTPCHTEAHKIKKTESELQIKLKRNPDILAWVAALKSRPYVVGFAAESQNLETYAAQKLQKKKLDLICANDISQPGLGFDSDYNQILILDKKGIQQTLPRAKKSIIALGILNEIGQHL